MNLALRFVLGIANVPDKLVDDLQNDLPALARLDEDFKDMQPDFELALPHLKALAPIAARLVPRLVEAYPDFKTVEPLIPEFLKLAQDKGK